MATFTIHGYTLDGDNEELEDLVYDLYRPDDLFNAAQIRPPSVEEYAFVAVLEHEIVGAVTFGVSDQDACFSVVTDPKHRRKGIAKALVQAVIDQFNELASEGVVNQLRAWVVNPDAMIPLLESLGFEVESSEWSPDAPHMVLA